MASVVERTTKSGERRLYVTFNAKDRVSGKRRKVWELQPTHLKNDANARKAEIEIGLRRSGGMWPLELVTSNEVPQTLKARGSTWLPRQRASLRERVFCNYEASLKNHVYPTLGTRPMDDLGPADVKLLRDTMRARGLSDDTVRAALVPLRGIVRDWAEDTRRPDPIAGVRLFKRQDAAKARREIVPPEPDQIAALIEHARPEARDAIAVAAATGLRRGELFGLRWRDIDLGENVLRVRAYNFAGRVEDDRYKTDAGKRDVPLLKSIRVRLLERKARERFSGPDDFVFGTVIGTAVDPNNFVKRELKLALLRAQANALQIDGAQRLSATDLKATIVETNSTPDDFRWHDLRHYAVSMLIAQKADILTLARIAGHADPNVTLKVYGHLMKGALAEAAELYDPLSLLM